MPLTINESPKHTNQDHQIAVSTYIKNAVTTDFKEEVAKRETKHPSPQAGEGSFHHLEGSSPSTPLLPERLDQSITLILAQDISTHISNDFATLLINLVYYLTYDTPIGIIAIWRPLLSLKSPELTHVRLTLLPVSSKIFFVPSGRSDIKPAKRTA